MKNKIKYTALTITLAVLLSACSDRENFNAVEGISEIIPPLPKTVVEPSDNISTPEKIKLGKQLFYDPILSANKDVACATCHHPQKGYADAQDLSVGVGGVGLGENRKGSVFAKRNAHTILNTAFNGMVSKEQIDPKKAPMFWDNRALSLESQSLLPILSKEEMRGEEILEDEMYDVIIERLSAIPEYKNSFKKVFGTDEITTQNIAKAIASFERTLIANNSPYDRYIRGDKTAMSQKQVDGMNAFVNVGCASCHFGPMLSDYKLHTLGVVENPKLDDKDIGAGKYDFRTPTLRNLAYTAPYMHNGMHETLEEVMNFYVLLAQGNNGGEDGDGNNENELELNKNINSNKISPLARQLNMEDDVNDAIIEFLNALNDPDFDKTIPKSVPSGLSVGGNIK